MSEFEAKTRLFQFVRELQHGMDFPNVLHAPPDENQLYADGKPDIEIGALENGLRFGIRYKDRPRSVICCGSAGSGKTSCIRRIVTLMSGDCDEETDLHHHL